MARTLQEFPPYARYFASALSHAGALRRHQCPYHAGSGNSRRPCARENANGNRRWGESSDDGRCSCACEQHRIRAARAPPDVDPHSFASQCDGHSRGRSNAHHWAHPACNRPIKKRRNIVTALVGYGLDLALLSHSDLLDFVADVTVADFGVELSDGANKRPGDS